MKKINYLAIVVSIVFMVLIDTSGWFSYFQRSFLKLLLFGLIPFILLRKDRPVLPTLKPDKNLCRIIITMIVIIVVVFVGAYMLNMLGLLDGVKDSVGKQVGVTPSNYPLVFIYIVLVNGPLEEFFFRYFILKQNTKYSRFISSLLFALYHVGMLFTMFPWFIFVSAIVGLIGVGYFFIIINSEKNSLLNSILIHMAANFVINAVGWILIM